MASAKTVLLPKVFPSNLVSLGQLVRNPLTPNANAWTAGCNKVEATDKVKGSPETGINKILNVNKKGLFGVSFLQYVGLDISGRLGDRVRIEAASMTEESLKDASAVFKKIIADAQAKKWVADMVLNKAPCYFVIGTSTLEQAKFTRIVSKKGAADAHAEFPLEQTGQMPLHLKGNVSGSAYGKSEGTVTGVWGVEVQKLEGKIKPAAVGTGDPVLGDKVRWMWTYERVKGTQKEEEKMIEVELVDADIEELIDLLQKDNEDD